MTTSKKTLTRVIQELGEEQEKNLKDHPSTEELLYYLEGILSAKRTDQVQAHISLCRVCADGLLELNEPLDFVPDRNTRFHSESSSLNGTTAEPNKEEIYRGFHSRWLPAVAALLLFFTGFLLRPYLMPTKQPMVNPKIESISPLNAASSTRGSSRISTPLDGEPLILHLNLAQDKNYSSYRILITDERDKRIWESMEARPGDEGGRFTIVLPPDFLPSGFYRVSLSGKDGQRWEEMKKYAFTLVKE